VAARSPSFFLICIVGGGGWSPNWVHSARRIVPAPGDCEDGEFGGMNWQGKPKYSEKTCPDATFSTTNPTWPDPGLNPGRRGGKPATNRFSYGAATRSPSTRGKTSGHIRCVMRLGGFQNQSGSGDERKVSLLSGIQPQSSSQKPDRASLTSVSGHTVYQWHVVLELLFVWALF
jgi:hypothetical protein